MVLREFDSMMFLIVRVASALRFSENSDESGRVSGIERTVERLHLTKELRS
jgi:hypothetical protein